jgi:hypothetical protein
MRTYTASSNDEVKRRGPTLWYHPKTKHPQSNWMVSGASLKLGNSKKKRMHILQNLVPNNSFHQISLFHFRSICPWQGFHP